MRGHGVSSGSGNTAVGQSLACTRGRENERDARLLQPSKLEGSVALGEQGLSGLNSPSLPRMRWHLASPVAALRFMGSHSAVPKPYLPDTVLQPTTLPSCSRGAWGLGKEMWAVEGWGGWERPAMQLTLCWDNFLQRRCSRCNKQYLHKVCVDEVQVCSAVQPVVPCACRGGSRQGWAGVGRAGVDERRQPGRQPGGTVRSILHKQGSASHLSLPRDRRGQPATGSEASGNAVSDGMRRGAGRAEAAAACRRRPGPAPCAHGSRCCRAVLSAAHVPARSGAAAKGGWQLGGRRRGRGASAKHLHCAGGPAGRAAGQSPP